MSVFLGSSSATIDPLCAALELASFPASKQDVQKGVQENDTVPSEEAWQNPSNHIHQPNSSTVDLVWPRHTSTTCFFVMHLISIEGSKAQNLAMNRFFTMLKISRGILPIWLVQLLFQCLMKMSCSPWGRIRMLFHSATGNVLRITWISSWQAMSLTTWDARAGQRQFCSEKHRNHQMLNSLGAWVLSPNEVFKKTFISRKDHTISKSWVLQTGAFFSYVLSKHQDRDASGAVLWSLQRGWCMAQLCHVWFWLGACFTCKDPQCLNLWTSRHHQVAPTVTMEQAAWVSFLRFMWVWWFWMEQNRAAGLPGACHCQVDVGFHWLLRPGCCSTHHCHGGVNSSDESQASLECVSCSHWSPILLDSKGFVSPNVLCWGVHQPKCMRTHGFPWKWWVSIGKHFGSFIEIQRKTPGGAQRQMGLYLSQSFQVFLVQLGFLHTRIAKKKSKWGPACVLIFRLLSEKFQVS